jgi:hypothetical protein
MINYFDNSKTGKLRYTDFIQVLLPCDDSFLRAAATQRPNSDIKRCDFLSMRVERALSQLLFKEVRYHLKSDLMKRNLENSYDFTYKKAF